MLKLAEQYNWDIHEFQQVYQKIVDLNYSNQFIYQKKSSPNKKYVCNIICEQEVSYVDIYLEIRRKKGNKLIKRERLVREAETYESAFFSHIGSLTWTLNHKVTLMDDQNRKGWKITFLEKENLAELFWKTERITNL